MKNKYRFKKNEKGIALIFSLAILSIFLVIFLTFSFSSRLKNKIANAEIENIEVSNSVDYLVKDIIGFIEKYDSNYDDNTDEYPPLSFGDSSFELYNARGEKIPFVAGNFLKKTLISSAPAIIPAAPAMPAMPAMPAVAGVVAVLATPYIPGTPYIPAVQGRVNFFSGVTTPAIPAVAAVPAMPAVAAVAGVAATPYIPATPAMPATPASIPKTISGGMEEGLALSLGDYEYRLRIPIAPVPSRNWNVTLDENGEIIQRSAWLLISRDDAISSFGGDSINPFATSLYPSNSFFIANKLVNYSTIDNDNPIIDKHIRYKDTNGLFLQYPTDEVFYEDTIEAIPVDFDSRKMARILSSLAKNFTSSIKTKTFPNDALAIPVEHIGKRKYLHNRFNQNGRNGRMRPYRIRPNSTVDEVARSIPWLNLWRNRDKANYSTGKNRGKQIAANILDLLDRDSIPRHDADFNYFGLEDVPHINEVVVLVKNLNPSVRREENSPLLNVRNSGVTVIGLLNNNPLLNDRGEKVDEGSANFLLINLTTGVWNSVVADNLANAQSGIFTRRDKRGKFKFYYKLQVIFEIVNLGIRDLYQKYVPSPVSRTGNFFFDTFTNLARQALIHQRQLSNSIRTSFSISGSIKNNNNIIPLLVVANLVDNALFKVSPPFSNTVHYKQLRQDYHMFQNITGSFIGASSSISNFSATFSAPIRLIYDDIIYDYVKSLGTSLPVSIIDLTNLNIGVGWAINDPRQNLNEEDWTKLIDSDHGTIVESVSESVSDASRNPITLLSNMTDQEPSLHISNAVPWSVSSNKSNLYSREGIDSISDLGIVHRGEAWQTLNLSNYVLSPTSSRTYNSNAYDPLTSGQAVTNLNGGDANILEQINLNSYLTVPSMLSPYNINGVNRDVFKQLSFNIDGSFITGSSNVIDDLIDYLFGNSNASPEVSPLIGGQLTENPPALFYFKHQYASPELRAVMSTFFSRNTISDFDKEKFIIKAINLLEVRYSYYSLVAVVQKIKEVPAEIEADFDITVGGVVSSRGVIKAKAKVKIDFRKDNVNNVIEILSRTYLDD